MPSYAETAQTIYMEYVLLKGFLMFIGLILMGYGIWWVIDKIRGKNDKNDTTNDT